MREKSFVVVLLSIGLLPGIFAFRYPDHSNEFNYEDDGESHHRRHQSHYLHRIDKAVNELERSMNSKNLSLSLPPSKHLFQRRHSHRSSVHLNSTSAPPPPLAPGEPFKTTTISSPPTRRYNNVNHHLRHPNRHHETWEKRVFPALRHQLTTNTAASTIKTTSQPPIASRNSLSKKYSYDVDPFSPIPSEQRRYNQSRNSDQGQHSITLKARNKARDNIIKLASTGVGLTSFMKENRDRTYGANNRNGQGQRNKLDRLPLMAKKILETQEEDDDDDEDDDDYYYGDMDYRSIETDEDNYNQEEDKYSSDYGMEKNRNHIMEAFNRRRSTSQDDVSFFFLLLFIFIGIGLVRG